MNKNFYKDLDTNFEQACIMSEKEFSHNELIEMLKNGNIPQKQIAALKLSSINCKTDADILISNLTGCDGKIREAVALKINQLLTQSPELSKFFINYPDIFADATIDINANICRLVTNSVAYLIKDKYFLGQYCEKILFFIQESFDSLDKIVYKDKKYTINKQLFKLYWCLEALKIFVQDMPEENLLKILKRACEEKEYTIKEKVAQIVVNLKSDKFIHIKTLLQNDENYYVRAVFENKNY